MGIQGLLPLLKYCMEDVNIKKFTRKKCAVDTYSWIHKAIYGSASDIVANPNSSKWISYCMTYLDMLLGNNMEVYLVFDGDSLIAKKSTEGTRSENRKKNLEEGMRCLSNGDYTNARSHMARGIDVTPHMAAKFIQVCKMYRPNVHIIVAPYEADAQLSFMSINNIVDIIITEDSDLIAFGCKEIIYKLDRYSGSCQYIRYDNIFRSISVSGTEYEVKPSNRNNAISAEDNMNLSQKDAESPGTGYAIKSAYKTVSKFRSSQKILKNLRFGGQLPMTTVSVEVPVEMYHATGACMMMSQQGTVLLSQSQPSSSQDSLYLSQNENLNSSNGSYSVEDRRACHVLDACYPVQLCVDKIQEWKKIDLLKYELQFYQAMLTFHHQVVFDVIHREMCYLKPLHGHGRSSSPDHNSIATLSNYSLLPASTDIPTYMLFARECGDNKTALSYLGTIIDDKDLACGIADGMIDPISKEYFNLPPLNEAIARTFSPAASSSKQKQATNKSMFAISKTNSVSIVRQSSLSSTNSSLSHESSAGHLFTPFDNEKNLKSICSHDISDDCITHKSKTTQSQAQSISPSPPLLAVIKHGDTQSQMTTSYSSINSFRSSADRNYSNNFLKRFLTESSSNGPRNVMLPTASDDKLNTSIASLSSSIQSNKRLSTSSCPSSSSSHSRHRHEASSLMFDQFNSKLENSRSLSCTSNSQHHHSASKPPAGIMKFLKKTSVYVSTPTSVSIANLNMTASKKANDRINQLADLSHQYKKNKVYDVNIDDKFTKKHVASDSNGIASSFDEMFGYHDDCGNYNETGRGGQETTYCDSMSPPIPVLKSCGRILNMPAMSSQQKRASEFSLDALQSSYLGSCKKNPICLLDQDSPQWTCASEGENINKDSTICDSTCFVARSSDCDRYSSGDTAFSESLSEKVCIQNDPSDVQIVFGNVKECTSKSGMRETGSSSDGVDSCSLTEGCVTHDSTHVISGRNDSSEAEGVDHVKKQIKKTSKKKTSISSENVYFTGTSTSSVVPEIQLDGNTRRTTRSSKSFSKLLNEHKNMKFVSFDGFEYKDE